MKKIIQHYQLSLLILLVSVLTSSSVHAQYEPQFTQYMYNEIFINPAYVGSHENISTALLYRNQWVGIEGAPKTQTFSIHSPICKRKLGIGFSVMNENIGVTHQLSVYANVAYRILFSNKSALSFGLQEGFVNIDENNSDVFTITPGDNQFSNDIKKHFLPNAGFGLYYYKENFYAGLSIPRLLENLVYSPATGKPDKNTFNFQRWHYYLTTGYVFQMSDDIKFKPSLMVKTVQNAPVELDVSAHFLFNEFLWAGGSYRTGDAVSLMVGLQLTKQLRFGYSYDYTLTDLQQFNSGSHEFTLGYEFSLDKTKVISTRYF